MFDGKFRLLTLLHLVRNDFPFDKRTLCGVKRLLSKMFLSHRLLLLLPLPKIVLNTRFAISPRRGAVAEAINPISSAPPFCPLFVLILGLFPSKYEIPFLLIVFPLSFQEVSLS